ncbi:Chitinase [Labilithrix luteola]|uniref:Chitinase n=1 Tax=Labilithrix luteola TaxID=1391654 RepID=A0A0K1PR38_9BACT|nr:M36 family metallopeptidase [Labilithrix luteola]AKU95579.1 Chitinase [Labilithrix luteola]
MRFARLPVIAPVALALLAACGTGADSSAPKAETASPDAAGAVERFTPTVVHRNAELGVPTFTWLRGPAEASFKVAATTTAEQVAWAAVGRARETLGLKRNALAAAAISEVDTHGTGPIVARVAQKVGGIDVFLAQLKVAMTRAKEPVALSGYLAPTIEPRVGHAEFALSATECAGAALRTMTGEAGEPAFVRQDDDGAGYERYVTRNARARVKKVWFPRAKGLDAAYYVELDVEGAGAPDTDARSFVVDASDASILFEKNLVAADSFTYRAFADSSGKFQPYDGPLGNGTLPHPTGTPNRVQFPFVASNLVTLQSSPFSKNDPWLPADATGTTGNNVDAYADLVAPDGFTAGDLRPAPTSKTFDFAYDNAKNPYPDGTQRSASTVQLFYTMNFLHDWFYDAGFDEKAGNHQNDNFGRGGIGNDALRAEAQDYSGLNNSNARTVADGAPSRVQMFVFYGLDTFLAQVTEPASVGDLGEVNGPGFGPTANHDFTSALVVADDGAGASATDACEPLVNNVTGKIVLVDVAACTIKRQVLNAQTAGARGVLVAGNVPNVLPVLLNDGSIADAITIPSLGISKQKGDAIKAALVTGSVTARMKKQYRGPDRDAAFDVSLASHEWGHTMAGRLVHDASGLTGLQGAALSEALADFVALLMTVRADDAQVAANANWSGTYAISNYVGSGGETNGIYFGLRRYPYSTDLTKNPLTFKLIQDNTTLPGDVPVADEGPSMSEVHNAGEVFAVMLWECYAALLRDSGRLPFDEAQSRMKRYVVAALKLMPPMPTFIEARDAFLAAAAATDDQDFALFVSAFAKRGAGAGAVAPERTAAGNLGVVESFSATGTNIEFVGSRLFDDMKSCDQDGILDDGETGKLVVTVKNTGLSDLTTATATVTTDVPGLTVANGGKISFPPAKPFQTVSASVDVSMSTQTQSLPYALTIALTDPQLATPGPIRATHHGVGNFDLKADSSRPVDTTGKAWTSESAPSSVGNGFEWSVDNGIGYWHVADLVGVADHRLVSPALHVSTTEEFTLSFKTRWEFDSIAQDDQYFDGAVVEMSEDNGTTWTDVGAYFSPGYGGTIFGDGGNPLAGRAAFTAGSPNYPDVVQAAARFGTAYAGKIVKLRFRFASDKEWGSTGWDIQDLALTGITNTSFGDPVADTTACAPSDPIPTSPTPDSGADAGAGADPSAAPGDSEDGGCNVGSTRSSELSLWGVGALALVLTRRRRRA